MLKVNVGLSRKLSRDYNSTGFSLNLEGELCVGLDDPEGMIEKIKEFYDLTEEALSQQIERYEGESAIASRDEQPRRRTTPETERRHLSGASHEVATRPPARGRNGAGTTVGANGDAATNKQVQFLHTLAKRNGLTTPLLEDKIEQVCGRRAGPYELTKREAGQVIDALAPSDAEPANGRQKMRNGRR